jgi:hypothetical protein
MTGSGRYRRRTPALDDATVRRVSLRKQNLGEALILPTRSPPRGALHVRRIKQDLVATCSAYSEGIIKLNFHVRSDREFGDKQKEG